MYNVQLDALIAVADCGSFNKAAEHLYITPTAVMKQINALEKHVGLTLFHRTAQGVSLTEEGISIYKNAKQIIAFSNTALEEARQIHTQRGCLIRIGTSLMNPCKAFMDIWQKVNEQNPKFKMKIVPFDDSAQTILQTLGDLGKDFDMLVSPCNSKEWLKRCSFYPLGEYKICCAVPHKHHLAHKKILRLEDLYGEKLLMCRHGDSPILDTLREDLSSLNQNIQIIDTPFFYDSNVLNRAEEENIILLTLDGWKEVHPFLKTIPVKWNYTMPFGLVYSNHPSVDVSEFIAEIELTLFTR